MSSNIASKQDVTNKNVAKKDVAVAVRGLSKAYTIAHNTQKHTTAAEAMLHRLKNPLQKPDKETFWALKDIEFDICKGDVVGIIGRNGAGKSTLLKVLSRITEPTSGQIDLYGRVGSLLEVGTGFHPELTGRENVFLNGAILGMSRREIARQFDAIVDFSGTEKFLDTPVKRYSSGMYVRLAFAVAAHLNPEILIVDEVLAVGDAAFQKKCLGKMKDVSEREGKTVLFVSHNMAAVHALCTSCLYLKGGQVAAFGQTSKVMSEYLCAQTDALGNGKNLRERADRTGNGKIRCTAIAFYDMDNAPIQTVPTRQPFYIEVAFESQEDLQDIAVSVDVDTIEGSRVTTLFSGFYNATFEVAKGRGVFRCCVKHLPLRPDTYSLNIMLGNEQEHYDFVRGAALLDVQESVYSTGRAPGKAYGDLLASFEWSLADETA